MSPIIPVLIWLKASFTFSSLPALVIYLKPAQIIKIRKINPKNPKKTFITRTVIILTSAGVWPPKAWPPMIFAPDWFCHNLLSARAGEGEENWIRAIWDKRKRDNKKAARRCFLNLVIFIEFML